MAPLISCIVPAYNGERFIGEALESIFAQSYRPIEVIVVDDGSTDGTGRVVADCGRPVTCIRQQNRGAPAARNRGIACAAGELIAFLDADDLWFPEKLSRQAAAMESQPQLAYCVTHVQNFWMDELAGERDHFVSHPRGRPMPGYITGALLARRRTFGTVGLFDEGLRHGDSADWFLRARREGVKGVLLEDTLVHRRLHWNNTSRHQSEQSRGEFLSIIKRSLDLRRQHDATAASSGAPESNAGPPASPPGPPAAEK